MIAGATCVRRKLHVRRLVLACAIAAVPFGVGGCWSAVDEAQRDADARELLATAERLAVADDVLARALSPTTKGWWEEAGAGLVGVGGGLGGERAFTSPGWRSARMGPEYEIGARLPERADGAIEIGIGQSERYRMRLWPEGASAVAGAVHDGRVVYACGHGGTDVVAVAEAQRVELLYVVREPAETVALEWRVELGDGFSTIRPGIDGALEVLDAGGNMRLKMPRPYAIDARGERREAALAVEDGRVRVDLDARGMAAPVLLDPAIEVGAWVSIHPGGRAGSALAYDAGRGRTVLFGGASGGLLADTWEWDGTAWMLRASTGPGARFLHAMAYDSIRQRTLLFGGRGAAGDLGDTWEWDGTAWTQRSTSGPPARGYHALAHDSARGRTVLFGGYDGGNFGDTWEWDGTAWTQRAATGPPARRNHALAYDASRGRTVLFGGYDGNNFGDTWEWDGTAWMLRATMGPPARSDHALAYDAARRQTVLVAGTTSGSNPSYFGDTWEWDGTAWVLRSTAGPAARSNHALAYDAARGRVVLVAGTTSGLNLSYFGDTWEWDGTAWMQRGSTGPTPREQHALAYDSARDRTVLFGGYNSSTGVLTDTWEWNGIAWLLRATTGPSWRYQHAMAYDTLRGRTVLFGGQGAGRLGDTWEWDGTSWSQRSLTGPPARALHAMSYDTERGRTVLFGGCGGGYLGDTWEWDGTNWTQQSSTGPPGRCGHGLAFDSTRRRTVLFGGDDDSFSLDDTWEWDGISWTQRAAIGPPPRSGGGLAHDAERGRTLLFGGWDGSGNRSDTWEWNGTAWTAGSSAGPSGRRYHGMAYDTARARTVLFGGYSGTAYLGDTWEHHRRGGPCTAATDCEPGVYCTDGVCCDEPSCDICAACNLAADPGVCSPVANAEDPDSCTAPDTCGPTGACVKQIGASCTTDNGCASAHCEDGVCCDHACGVCEACTKAKRDPDGADPSIVGGECGPVRAGTDVDDDCAQDADFPQSCRADGMCDGVGACRPFALSSVVCATATCDANANTAFNFFCAGDAAFCKPTAIGSSCFPGLCVALACVLDCASDADCDAGAYCGADGACKGGRTDSEACERREQCASGFCADGVCCNGPCKGQCEACDAAGDQGVCVPVIGAPHGDRATCAAPSCDTDTNAWFSFACAGDRTVCEPSALKHDCPPGLCAKGACVQTCKDDDDCADGAYCNAGTCEFARADGKTCGRAEQCGSGFCTDGVCCNLKCDGQCEACDVEDALGSCTPVVGQPHGERSTCDPGRTDDPCSAASCDGAVRRSCEGRVGSDTVCAPAKCDNGMASPDAVCNGQGACRSVSPTSCGSYACGADACMTKCASDADCTGGATCVDSKCIVATTCLKDGHTVQGPEGDHDCAPFRCDTSGTCLAECASTADCVSGARCTSAHECVPAPDAGVGPASSISGCGCRVAGAPESVPSALWPLAVPVLARLRRRLATWRSV